MRKLLGITAAIAGLLGVNVWTIWGFIWSLQSGGLRIVGDMELHPPFFLLLACIAISFTIVLPIVMCREAIRLWSPRNRFHMLHGDFQQLGKDISQHRFVPREAVLTLNHKLEKLRIQCPDLDDAENWSIALPYFASWSETKNIKAARQYRPGLEEFM